MIEGGLLMNGNGRARRRPNDAHGRSEHGYRADEYERLVICPK